MSSPARAQNISQPLAAAGAAWTAAESRRAALLLLAVFRVGATLGRRRGLRALALPGRRRREPPDAPALGLGLDLVRIHVALVERSFGAPDLLVVLVRVRDRLD